MRLELAEFPVASIKLADRFHYAAGQLTVDKSAIEQSVLQEGAHRGGLARCRRARR